MPRYDYICRSCDFLWEDSKPIENRHEAECPVCGAKGELQPAAAAIQFKGTGFYATDYKGKR